VKYAQCVKIWIFDVLVLFLKCMQFLKPCVHFLVDTILNLTIVQFFMKKKGDTRYEGVSRISRKRRCALCGHVSYMRQREACVMGARLPFT
jgi:hypothetical protein